MKTRVLRHGSVKGAYNPSSNHPFYGWHRLCSDFDGDSGLKAHGEVILEYCDFHDKAFELVNCFFHILLYRQDIGKIYIARPCISLIDTDQHCVWI